MLRQKGGGEGLGSYLQGLMPQVGSGREGVVRAGKGGGGEVLWWFPVWPWVQNGREEGRVCVESSCPYLQGLMPQVGVGQGFLIDNSLVCGLV
jgi:hypothetical protein